MQKLTNNKYQEERADAPEAKGELQKQREVKGGYKFAGGKNQQIVWGHGTGSTGAREGKKHLKK